MGATMLSEPLVIDATEAAPHRQARASGERISYAPAVAEQPRQVIYKPFGPKMQVLVVIRQPERIYRLKGTLVIDLEQEEDGVCASHRTLPVMGYGGSAAEAIADFAEMFDAQYRGLVEESDAEELSAGGRQARRQLEALVEDISTP